MTIGCEIASEGTIALCPRVRVRRSDLDAYIAESAKRHRPSEARVAFDNLARDVTAALRRGTPDEAAGTLRELSAAALVLADELQEGAT